MIQTINLHDFRQAFHDCGRGEQFSYEALELIFKYYEQYEADSGEKVEMDVIDTCCDLSELTPVEILEQYDVEHEGLDDDELMEAALEYLNDNTIVVGQTDDTIIFFQF